MAMELRLSLVLLLFFTILGTSSSIDHIERGFSARPRSSSSVKFQSVLTDSTSTFSLGFLRCGGGGVGVGDSSLLDLAIIHLPSSFPLWRAAPSKPCSFSWSTSTSLLFNGSLTLTTSSSSSSSAANWSTNTPHGDRLTLLSSSNLQISSSSSRLLCWQSFHFPSDSIIQNQNFTTSSSLLSHNRRYSMKLGTNFLALYATTDLAGNNNNNMIMYWKRTAMEAKAQIVDGRGPIYARLDPTGFLGLYQTEQALVDLLPFDSFNAGTQKSLRRLTLESDGNLRAYYSNVGGSWVPDFEAISPADRCSLPAVCGAYGVCHMVEGNARCGCLDNRTATEGCFPADSGDLCGSSRRFGVVRRRGVELANSLDHDYFVNGLTLEECESWCERNCSCWGALYSNTTSAGGYCYLMDYPIQTLLAVGDHRKIGYFKVRNNNNNNIFVTTAGTGGGEEEQGSWWRRARVALILLVCGCGFGFAGYRVWRINGGKWWTGGGGMPSYKPLISTSFTHIQLTNSFSKESKF